MGLGDTLMSMGEAKRLHKQTRQPVLIVGRDGRPIQSDLFNGVPYLISKPPRAGAYQSLVNGPGIRGYIAGKTPEKWTWRKYQPEPADLVFTRDELEFADRYRGRVMIEPNIKAIGHGNKAWLAPRWSELAAALDAQGIDTIQCIPSGSTPVFAKHVALTPGFRYACAVLAVSRAFIGTEGGLMHAAAAVGTPAVILWSEFISPSNTGYPSMRNLRHAASACGMRTNCKTCAASMERITVGEVLTNLKETLACQ